MPTNDLVGTPLNAEEVALAHQQLDVVVDKGLDDLLPVFFVFDLFVEVEVQIVALYCFVIVELISLALWDGYVLQLFLRRFGFRQQVDCYDHGTVLCLQQVEMPLDYYLVFFFFLFGEPDVCAKAALFPEDGSTASQTHVREQQVVAHEDLLGLHIVGGVETVVDATTVETGPRHVLAPSAHIQVVEREVCGLGMDFFDVALHDGDPPAHRKFMTGEYLEQVLVPEVLALGGQIRIEELLVVGQSYVLLVTKVEIVKEDLLPDSFQDLFGLRLVHRAVEELVLERDELDALDLVDPVSHEGAYGVAVCDQADEGLLVDGNDADDEADLFAKLVGDVPGVLLEGELAHVVYLGSEAVDADELAGGERTGGLELSKGRPT